MGIVAGDIVVRSDPDAVRERMVVIYIVPADEEYPERYPALAALRPEGQLIPDDPQVLSLDRLEVVGHLEKTPGWVEVEHGRWRKVGDE